MSLMMISVFCVFMRTRGAIYSHCFGGT